MRPGGTQKIERVSIVRRVNDDVVVVALEQWWARGVEDYSPNAMIVVAKNG